jgi:arginase family enzyme
MTGPLIIIGAPSSAGAYAPGQEKAPGALRAAGLLECLRAHGIQVDDRGLFQHYNDGIVRMCEKPFMFDALMVLDRV